MAAPGATVMTVAVARDAAFCHHCVSNPLSPHPVLNFSLYLPGWTSSSE